ncbi:Uncharacterized protein HA466_0117070 [Hirschfeldia incana]|nr:Uncharacterized protein HA466_0117070 [Hirschfeldia incana]
MSSNGEKGMVKRSDFAQKLLDDLRVRKERLSISQDTDSYGYSNRGFKGSRERRTKSTTFQDFNFGGANLLTSSTENSNQILPYGKGQSIDLSKALAFALENAGKATRADPSGNASVISFLHEVGKRSLGLGTSSERRSSQQQLPMVHVHIKEISKGAQKLNQIIKACSNGLSFRKGRYSIQCGEEQHMEGAIELEQSLRLLVDIQQASSDYITKKHSQNRFKLLEENDEEEEEEDVWNRNNRKIKESAKADIEMRLLALNNRHRRQTSSCEDKPQKGRIPNVVAKLMGIGEFPEEEKETKNNNDASINKYAESLTRRRANENIVELKDQRNSTPLDLVLHKETQRTTTNGVNYKDKAQQKDDSNSRKGNKKDGEMTAKNAMRRNSSPTEDKPKAVTRSQQKPSFGKKDEAKSIRKAKLKPERHQEHVIMTNHPPKPLRSVPVTDKAKPMRKSFSHVEVLEKKKGGEVHEAEFRQKKNQDTSNLNGGFCKVMKQPENQKPVSKEANGKQDQLLGSYNDSNKTKAVEAETCVNPSEDSGVDIKSSNRNVLEQKKEIKDDSILLIAAERVLCQEAPSDNHHELIFRNGVDQQAPVSNSYGNPGRFSETVYTASEGEVEAGIPLLEKLPEVQKQETKDTVLSENEMNLKKIVVKSQLFLDTFEALFKLNIPLNVLHEVGGNNYYQEDKNLLLDCGYEIMKRKGRFQDLSVHPFVKVPISSSKVNSLDHLVRQLSKEFEKLRTYGRECYTESLVEDYLPKVLERDVYYKDPNLNSMWDMGWSNSMDAFIERDDVIRDVEREVFNGLLEEITRDLICI